MREANRFPAIDMPLTLHSLVVASDDQVSTTVGESVIILGMKDGVYYGLERVGARVWPLLQRPLHVNEMVDTLVAEFDVAAEQCGHDLLVLLEDLVRRGLVRDVTIPDQTGR